MGTKEIPDDVRKQLEEARRNTGPRKHHLVPSSYLDRWAVDGNIRVRQLERAKSHLARPHKAARETDYYRAESDDLDPDVVPPMIFETILSRVEGPAVAAIDQLIAMPDEIDLQARYDLATFMAFQHTRGHRQRLRIRATINEFFKLQTRDMNNEQIRRVLARDSGDVTPQEVERARALIDEL